MPVFTPERADAIRAELITQAAADLHGTRSSVPSSSLGDARPVRTPRGHRMQWAAAAIALVLVGGIAGAAITSALNAGGRTTPNPGTTVASPPADEADADIYVGSGTVIEREGLVKLCLGGRFHSYPPGCEGPAVVLKGWDWDHSPAYNEAGDIRFTDNLVTVSVSGTVQFGRSVAESATLTVSNFSSIESGVTPPTTGTPTPKPPSGKTDEELRSIAETSLRETIGTYSAGIFNGIIDAYVALDADGALQRAADDAYGKGVVYVNSLLTLQ